ncbi:DUF2953 domain-containing protein [Radiobacillus kanasensis]|uniref:DUF2953 domain-containing protein n=1 Tax=Radiobacillus kanasensis TaxID=2844358 RepID=UPI001E2A246C|nr:DUF2953 domain-containing protein [Radiobacillus kanasensis]UFT98034.1 DUF2953 domain-containing protein [Radiobacillus kanasensis]
MFWFIVILLFILLCIVGLFLPIYATVDLILIPKQSEGKIILKVWKLPILKKTISFSDRGSMIDIPQMDHTESSYSDPYVRKLDMVRNWIESSKQWKRNIERLLRPVKIHRFNWISRVGVGDASMTGVLSGSVWAMKGTILRYMGEHMNFKTEPSIQVIPLFQQAFSMTKVECMVSIRIGQAIYAFIQLLKTRKKQQKKVRTSNLTQS